MRVIVTGGAGAVSAMLMESLTRDGHEVIVLTRHPQKTIAGLTEGVKMVEWDGRSSAGWAVLADGAGAILNFAGEDFFSGYWTEARKRRFRESRVHAGQAVVEAVEQAQIKPRVLIQSSSVYYYGTRTDVRQVTEKAPPGKGFLPDLIAEWEKSTASVEQYGVRRVIIRCGVILSRDSTVLRRLAMPYRFFIGGRLGSGKQWFPWIHIADGVAAIRYLLENGKASGPYNLTAPNSVNNHSFGHVLAQVLNRPAYLPVPAFLVRLLFGERSVVMLEGQRAMPKRLQELGFRFRYPDVEPALRDLYGKNIIPRG